MRLQRALQCAISLAFTASVTGCARQAASSDATARQDSVRAANAAVVPQGSAAPASTSIALDAGKGKEIGAVYEAFLSPWQEPGEEKDTPGLTPKQFKSTGPSLLRSERTSRGHGALRFTNDLSRAYVDVKVENIDPSDVNMFHIHCGRPDMLGPILVDFALTGNIQENLKDGTFSVELTDADIEKTAQSGEGALGEFLIGCPIVPGQKDKVKTIGGMQYIAQVGDLYFNLHTKGQTYYGNIRGQLKASKSPAR